MDGVGLLGHVHDDVDERRRLRDLPVKAGCAGGGGDGGEVDDEVADGAEAEDGRSSWVAGKISKKSEWDLQVVLVDIPVSATRYVGIRYGEYKLSFSIF
jgi:hypothetical protein